MDADFTFACFGGRGFRLRAFGDALRAGASDPDGFTLRFLEAVRREAADGRDLLLAMEREWREARVRVDRRAGARSNSRLPAAVDLLAASPLLSITALADALGCSVEGASRIALDEALIVQPVEDPAAVFERFGLVIDDQDLARDSHAASL